MFPELWSGLGGLLAYSVLFSFSFLVFTFAFPLIFLALHPLAGGMAMAFADDLFPSLRARPSFLSFFLRTLSASLPRRSEV